MAKNVLKDPNGKKGIYIKADFRLICILIDK